MDENDIKIVEKKLRWFFDEKKKVHILLTNNFFYNGDLKYVGADFCLLEDRYRGEICIFFGEVKLIEPFRDDTEEKSGHFGDSGGYQP